MNMRVEVVTGPVRYRLVPLLLLGLVMLVPVAGLSLLVLWSDEQADAHEAAEDGDVDIAEPAIVPPAAPVLDTPVLVYRRVPQPAAAEAADNRLASALEQVYSFMDGRSCAVVNVDGRAASTFNPTAPVIPASAHKLLVAVVALEQLGPAYRYQTAARAPSPVDGVVPGDLYLVGGGDPLLTSDDYPIGDDPQPAFNTTSLDALADAIVAAGVTRIDGAVVGDGSRYDDEWEIPSWGAGVAGVEAGPYDALLVNDSRTRGRNGRQSDPNLTGARELARLLADRGVSIDNGWDTGTATADVPVLATIESAPLEAVLTEMLTTSDDDTAEMVLKELGVATSASGTVAAGLNVVDSTLRGWGLPMDGVRFADGSGLSSGNQVTCALLAGVLDRLAATNLAAALPVAARSGTLIDEFAGTAVEGRLAAKTGTLGNPPVGADPPAVKSLVGLLEAPDGSTIEFAFVLNGDGVNEPEVYRNFWDAFTTRLAAYPAGPALADLGPR